MSEIIEDKEKRQYHIGLSPKEIAPYIILVGDQNRAHRAGKELLTDVKYTNHNREFVSYTGKYGETPVTVLSTGIGTDNMEITLIELFNICENPTLIRVGSSGGLQDFTKLGDMVVSSGAVRLENTSLFFVDEGYPAVANYEAVIALAKAAKELELPWHIGLTATASGFYGAQGRKIPGFPLRYPDLPDRLRELNVYNFEMETSTLFTLAAIKGARAGTVCTIYANRPDNTFISAEEKPKAELNALKVGLRGLQILEQMDKEKKGKKNWLPKE
ncbi:MAG: nucleoside phosphorylase [Candidatus Kariarchaeaceae archaeon]